LSYWRERPFECEDPPSRGADENGISWGRRVWIRKRDAARKPKKYDVNWLARVKESVSQSETVRRRILGRVKNAERRASRPC